MSIIGIDLGYDYTKTSDYLLFASRCTESQPLLGGKKLKIDGNTYYIGEGRGTVELNKIESDVTKACLFYALGKSQLGNEGIKIVTGLPIGHFQTQQDELKHMILNNRYKTICVDGETEKRIYIDDVKIYPQGAGALFGQQIYSSVIIIDIGGRTVDIAYFTYQDGARNLVKSGTLFCGMLSLYDTIISVVNSKFGLSLDSSFARYILSNGLQVNGIEQDITFIKPILAEHIESICENVRVNYPANATPIYLCGGGAAALFPAFQKKFPNVKMLNNSQFANAIGFKKVGETIWPTSR